MVQSLSPTSFYIMGTLGEGYDTVKDAMLTSIPNVHFIVLFLVIGFLFHDDRGVEELVSFPGCVVAALLLLLFSLSLSLPPPPNLASAPFLAPLGVIRLFLQRFLQIAGAEGMLSRHAEEKSLSYLCIMYVWAGVCVCTCFKPMVCVYRSGSLVTAGFCHFAG